MKRYYILSSLFCLLTALRTIAMEQSLIPEGKQEVEEKKETITVVFERDEDRPIDFIKVSLDCCKHFEVFNRMIESLGYIPSEWDCPLSKEKFKIIEQLLLVIEQLRVSWLTEASANDEVQQDELKKKLVVAIKKSLIRMNLQDLIELLAIADFLEASLVLEAGVSVYDENILEKFSKELSSNLKDHTQFFLFKEQIEKLNVPLSMHTEIITYLKEQLHFFKTYKVPVTKLKCNGKWINCIRFSPNGKYIVSGTDKGTVNVYNVETKTWEKTSADHTNFIMSISFSPDSTKFATASCDGTVKIWDSKSGKCVQTFGPYRARVKFVSFSPDGTKLAFVVHHPNARDSRMTSSTDIQVWDITPDSFTHINTWNFPKTSIDCVSFDPNSKHIAYANKDGIILLDIQGDCNEKLVAGDYKSNCVSFSPDGKYIAFAVKGTLWLYNIEQKVVAQKWAAHSSVSSISFSPDGKYIACAFFGGRIKLWDVTTGLCIKKLTGLKKDTNNSVSFGPDSTQLISSKDYKVMLWNIGDMFSAFDKLTLPQIMLLYMVKNGCINSSDLSGDDELKALYASLDRNIEISTKNPPILPLAFIISKIALSSNYIHTLKSYQRLGNF